MNESDPGRSNGISGPFRRSRTGCYTCRRRGKKCDERWNDQGFCQRCTSGPWTCTGRTEPATRNSNIARGNILGKRRQATNTQLPARPAFDSPSSPKQVQPLVDDADNTAMMASALFDPTGTDNGAQVLDRSNSQSTDRSWIDQPPDMDTDALSAFLAACEDIVSFPMNEVAEPIISTGVQTNESLRSLLQLDPEGCASTWSAMPTATNDNHNWPSRRGVSLGEIYALIFDSWLVGLPDADREAIRTQILERKSCNDRFEAVSYAVAATYTYLLTSDSACVKNPKRRLIELVYRSTGVSPPISELSDDRPLPVESTKDKISTAEKISKYKSNVSVPLEGDLENAVWIRDAMLEIQRALPSSIVQLAEVLWAVVNLKVVEYLRSGAAKSYAVLSLGDQHVKAVLGERPTIYLSEYHTAKLFSIKLFALSDLSRCIVHRGQRTLFNYAWSDYFSESMPPDASIWNTYIGLPDGLAALLGRIVDLCADYTSNPSPEIQIQAKDLEAKIRQWSPPPTSENVDLSLVGFRTTVIQIWKSSALIILYQSVHHAGSLHQVLRQSLSNLLWLLDSLAQLPHSDLCGFIGLPAFLAASLSVSAPDRERSMRHMVRSGPQRLWLDNIALIEKVWAEVDSTGRVVDWHEKMKREGVSVAFF